MCATGCSIKSMKTFHTLRHPGGLENMPTVMSLKLDWFLEALYRCGMLWTQCTSQHLFLLVIILVSALCFHGMKAMQIPRAHWLTSLLGQNAVTLS